MGEPYGESVREQGGGDDLRLQKVRDAVKAWTAQLVDLGGRNTLLYYKDLRQGTLDLGVGTDAVGTAVDSLLASRTVRLSAVFPDPNVLQACARRCRTIRAKAAENFEERGLQTLFLGWGMATWTNQRGTATPAAPVLLQSAQLTPRGAAAEDFDLSLLGEFEVNPTLLHLLATDHQIRIAEDELLDLLEQDGGFPDPWPLFERLEKIAGDVPGFGIKDRVVLGNFSYAKLPMVKDLQSATEQLLAHELILAIAGDELAREELRSRHADVLLEEPDHVPPADEFLVLDADASQNYVINAVLRGSDLVVQGPPGTGKSQTIGNLISTLVARGQRVLFVAEKRAAIDAVLERLHKVGLGDLVLDIHEGVSSRRRLAQELAMSLARASQTPLPQLDEFLHALLRNRSRLAEVAAAMHEPRSPWGLSVYECRASLMGIPDTVRSNRRLRGDTLKNLGSQAFKQAVDDLATFVELGGARLQAAQDPWTEALGRGSVVSASQAESALGTISTLAERTLPNGESAYAAARQRVIPRADETVALWSELVGLFDRVEETLGVFSADVFSPALDRLVADLRPAERGLVSRLFARLFRGAFRRARRAGLRLVLNGKLRSAELLGRLREASEQATQWSALVSAPDTPVLPVGLDRLRGIQAQVSREVEAAASYMALDLPNHSLAALTRTLDDALASSTLYKLPELHALKTSLERLGLGDVVREVTERQLSAEDAVRLLHGVWYNSILSAVQLEDRLVAGFDGEAHQRVVEEYQRLDREHLSHASIRVRRAWAERVTGAQDEFPAEARLVQAQARLRRKHLPVRDLFQLAPNVLTAVKPCWAMSPLVVSHVLPVRERYFDVVVFDEASQVMPADAVGALLRARRAVVTGDDRQLPPTRFFLASTPDDDEEEAALEEAYGAALTRDLESVLDVMAALLPPPKGSRTLGWHYRSHDERLIAFSNAHLYEWSLTTFPGITGEECLDHILVPFRVGQVGQEESAGDEVSRVVELILEHARVRPEQSLGVIAMGIKHADRIRELLRRTRPDFPELDPFFDESATEPFFVKNLERVQGDERDGIILSIGYGKTPDGRMLYRFGPLNAEGGERRLNVAVTRARSRMTLVSSFTAEDMDPDRLRAEGAKLLQAYLSYAASRGSDLGTRAREKPPLNPFERDVRDQLLAAGVPVIPQYGSSGYWVDFAAKHPTQPGRMVLAIECDGAMYHSSHTARERDRLRQEHLERMGWKFHRIWSADWFHHREREVERAVAAYQRAVEAEGDGDPPNGGGSGPDPAPFPSPPTATGSVPERTTRPSVPRGLSIGQYSQRDLVAIIKWIESDTLPRTKAQLVGESMNELGFERRGKNIVAKLELAIAVARGEEPPRSRQAVSRTARPRRPPQRRSRSRYRFRRRW
jgi:very-short-patch-repair endonuclease